MKDLKFSFTKSEFFVNEKKRTVACKISGVLTGFPGDVEEVVANHPASGEFTYRNHQFGIEQIFIGKAKCCDGDTFDETTGRQIAEARAKMKAYAFMYNLAKNAAADYSRKSVEASNTVDKYLAIMSLESGRVQKLGAQD